MRRGLDWRCTARYTDETLAIAGVLGIDVVSLLADTEGSTAEADDDEPFVQLSDLCANCKRSWKYRIARWPNGECA
jgi:hypothetical protein